MNKKQNLTAGLIILISITSIQFSLAITAPISTINNKNDTNNAIYQDKDKYGNIILTNKPSHHDAKKINLPPLTIYERPMTPKDLNIKNTSINYDNDDSNTSQQSSNQRGREYVLQEELSNEMVALQEAMSMLDYNKKLPIPTTDVKHQERIKIIEDTIHEHQKNIALLNNTLH